MSSKHKRIPTTYRRSTAVFANSSTTDSMAIHPPNKLRKTKIKSTGPKTPIIRPKTILERIFGSKKFVKDHYFSSGTKINESNVRDLVKEASPFKYPDDLDVFSYKLMAKTWLSSNRTKEMNLKYNERSNYTVRQSKDVLNRLFVESANVKCNTTILDIDPEFYSIVSGRPITVKFNLQEYMNTARDILRTKIVTGYRMDDALLIEENLLEEQNMIEEITTQYMLYLSSFEEYLAKDHETSMELLRASESEGNKSYEKYEAYRDVAKELGLLKSQVSNLEEKWRNAKTYQKFLYMVSPMYWRKQFDFYHMAKKEDDQEIEIIDSLVELEQTTAAIEYRSLDNIIRDFLKDYEHPEEPLLFFNEPSELNKIFRFIELQNLNSLLHSEELAVPLDTLRENMAATKAESNKQIADLKEITSNLEGEIVWEEERAITLEALARELINGEFRRLICDGSILNLLVMVEDVYEARVAANDANLSAYEMMKAVEIKYREHLLKLDYMPYDKVHKAEMECYAEQAKIMKVAEDASRKVVQIDRLVKRLRRILEPPAEHRTRGVKKRSMLHRPQLHEIHMDQPITAEEAEYFYLFTDFCEGTDNIKEYREIRQKEQEIEEQLLLEQKMQVAFDADEAALVDLNLK
ncbi:LOW QUALITY PROTEIN: uncharacterized protein [Atheta coriaria]|uniref:LOW QUALITY PROTEIN: uncharacterized protein n=1 Tax=Dalotia coriaria TaxID=877792 RepID=UPI0031F46910